MTRGTPLNLEGHQFGRLTAIEPTRTSSGTYAWLCRCDCGNETVVQIDRLTVGTTKSCGCLRLRSGKESPAYKHHITSAQRIKNRYQLNGLNKRNWRTAVFKRDRYTCQVCGTPKSGHLNAHHLDGWNWAHLLRFEVSNGITLCDSCHTDFHNAYGRGDNTKEQFQQYLSMKGKSA